MKFNTIALILFNTILANAKLVMIIRHGEKLNDEVTDLSPKGKARAECLINVFGNNGTYPTPQKIYAQSPTEKKQSTRPRDTVLPLSEAIDVPLDLSYTSGQVKKLANSIMNSSSSVSLVSWSNDKIPDLAERFGITHPPDWNNKVFDQVWMIYDDENTLFINNSTNKKIYNGSNNYKMEIAKQDIDECIYENIFKYQANARSASIKSIPLTSALLISILSLIGYVFIFY